MQFGTHAPTSLLMAAAKHKPPSLSSSVLQKLMGRIGAPKTVGEMLCSKYSNMGHVYNRSAKFILLIQISLRCHSHSLRRALFIIACLQSARFADALAGIGGQNLRRTSKATVERAIVGRMAGGAAVRVQGRAPYRCVEKVAHAGKDNAGDE